MRINKKSLIAQLAIASVLVLFGLQYVFGAFEVGISYSNAKPMVLVDETGASIDSSNPLPTAPVGGGGSITTVTDGFVDVATAGTAVPLAVSSTPFTRCTVQAKTDNVGVVTIGGSTVVGAEATRRGEALVALMSQEFNSSDLSLYYIDSENNGDGVTFFCES